MQVDWFGEPIDYSTAASEINAHLGSEYHGLIPTSWTLHDLTVTEETYPGANPAQAILPLEVTGLRSTPDTYLSPGLCPLLRLSTAVPKRYARGHMFMPPAISSNTVGSNGVWSTNAGSYAFLVDAFAAKLQQSFTGSSGSDYGSIVFSRTRVAQNATPYMFQVLSVTRKPEQHFLRSRAS